MEVNADFNRRISVDSDQMPWLDSPMAGVQRRMLDRLGAEVARATSIVRYAPASHFSAHVHSGGEEFLVLDGVFQDEHGDYPAGSYIRNPPQSKHTPGSAQGCTIFVKLWQFDLADRTHIVTHTDKIGRLEAPNRPGVTISPLYADTSERVQIEHWAPGVETDIDAQGGAELLILDGEITEDGEALGPRHWLRLPVGTTTTARAGGNGARLWVKSGHLRTISRPG